MTNHIFHAANRQPVEVRASDLRSGDQFLEPDGRLAEVVSARVVARRTVRVGFRDGRHLDVPELDLVSILGAEVGPAVMAEYLPAHREPGVLQ